MIKLKLFQNIDIIVSILFLNNFNKNISHLTISKKIYLNELFLKLNTNFYLK